LARTVRKVSRASTKNQQKEKKLSKKWWIVISSIVALIVIGVTVGLIVYFSNKEEEAYVSDMVYFTEPVKNEKGEEVEFIKENYQTLVRYLKAEKVEHMFVFAYDGSQFFADPEDEDNYDEKYVKLITSLANLQTEVNAAKEAGVSIELYIVDVNVDSQVNADIMYDSEYFGGLYGSQTTTFEPAFFYNHEGEYKATVDFNDKKNMLISTSSLDNISNSSITNAINYIMSLN